MRKVDIIEGEFSGQSGYLHDVFASDKYAFAVVELKEGILVKVDFSGIHFTDAEHNLVTKANEGTVEAGEKPVVADRGVLTSRVGLYASKNELDKKEEGLLMQFSGWIESELQLKVL